VHAPSCFETHRSATMLGRRRARSRCDAPQHEGRGRTVHFGETKPMGGMPACSIRNRPAVAGSDRRRRSIVFGLLFTMNAATRTCDTEIWRRSETLAPPQRVHARLRRAMAGRGWRERSERRVRGRIPRRNCSVTRGLDPRVHLFRKNFLQTGWIAGSSPAMTTAIAARACPSPASPLRGARETRGARLHLPRVSHGTGAGVGRGVGGELAVELGEQRNTVGEAIFGARRGERGILRRRRAVDNEARTRKRLE